MSDIDAGIGNGGEDIPQVCQATTGGKQKPPETEPLRRSSSCLHDPWQ